MRTMNNATVFYPTDSYKKLLLSAKWLQPNAVTDVNTDVKGWLLETGSMTKRLKQQCDDLQVQLIRQRDTKSNETNEKVRGKIGEGPSLLREVLLVADGTPWIYGLSYLPKTTLTGKEKALEKLGASPLGELVFSSAISRRDALRIAKLYVEDETLWARCSRLWINDKPLLVYELFLPFCPIYPINLKMQV
ncbi:chorismate--pyruvate lyase family protein [Motilimonas cestriensis]|uniref:chorismate--pyruvate lyase family protein n=1 Tax=Motilimonas cestriensis TaxID=2742685 RepID=UPI003DA2B0BD